MEPGRRILPTVVSIVALICVLTAVPVAPQPVGASEYRLKAAFLFNFLQFVEWPDTAFENPASPLVIGILGADPFGNDLDQLVAGETTAGRPIEVQRFAGASEAAHSHLLFISDGAPPHLEATLEQLRGYPVLTVGEDPGFTEHGGMIQFVTNDNRIRLQINLEVATSSQLRISSKLLRPSKIVTTARN